MDKKRTLLQFIKFGLVGLSNTAIAYAVYSLLILVGAHYLLANAASFVAGVLNSFYWNNKYVFKKVDGEQRNSYCTLAKSFVSYGITGLVLQSLLLYLFVEKIGINSLIAQLICLAITVPLNFILNKFWSFKTKKQ